jgi:hypothetical protein
VPHLIALIGPAGSGKTTLANQLSSRHGFIRKPFAANIKSMLLTFLQNQGLEFMVADRMLHGDLKETPTPYLGGRTPRHAMQTLGTEWRDMISRDLWIDAWEREVRLLWQRLQDINIVVDDMRFQHEVDRIRSMNGLVIRIKRDWLEIKSTHQSEFQYLSVIPDYIVENNNEPKEMLTTLTRLLSELNDA